MPESKAGCDALKIAQGSVLPPLFFSIYIYDLLVTVAGKFSFAGDLAILHHANNWLALDESLTQNMATLSSYLYISKIKLSTTKTLSATFHLYNKEARRELNVFVNRQALPFRAETTYLGINLDEALTFHRHL